MQKNAPPTPIEKPQSTRRKNRKKQKEVGDLTHDENNFLIFYMSFYILHFDI